MINFPLIMKTGWQVKLKEDKKIKFLKKMESKNKANHKFSYEDAGVNTGKASEAINLFKSKVFSTFNRNVLNDLVSYAGLFQLETGNYKNPVLVSSTDGVGTKVLIAKQTGDFSAIGQDLVAMCVNDILCCGAKPLFFLDYLACGKLEPQKIKTVVESIAEGCLIAGSALIGGETAEMPGVYREDDIDMAGFAVGIVDRDKIITKKMVKEGDILCGVASSGPHSNGYSLIRKIISDCNLDLSKNYNIDENNPSLGKILLTPTRIYVKILENLIDSGKVKGLAHITGGGFYENINRIIPENCNARINKKAWKVPSIFNFLQDAGNIEVEEMYRVFNMGIGMAIVIDKNDLDFAQKILNKSSENLLEIGVITKGSGMVEVV
ncbi:MAG: phosphoribosylformylglycinamidine cyclo-ligase [Actinobacteria bacterium]|nr:phosphoribosylformylglycinamidine cyclo-ligase [Actinomycetota bacterium]